MIGDDRPNFDGVTSDIFLPYLGDEIRHLKCRNTNFEVDIRSRSKSGQRREKERKLVKFATDSHVTQFVERSPGSLKFKMSAPV